MRTSTRFVAPDQGLSRAVQEDHSQPFGYLSQFRNGVQRFTASHVSPQSKAHTLPRRGWSHGKISNLGGNVGRQTIYDKPAQILEVLGNFASTSTR